MSLTEAMTHAIILLKRHKGRLVLALMAALIVAACSTGQKNAAESAAAPAEAAADAPGGSAITPEEVNLSDVHLFKGATPDVFRVEGKVQNASTKATLTEISLEMAMQDCLDSGVCNVIAQDTAKIPVNVAPGQTAAFETAANFKDMPKPQGTLGWHYSVVDAQGATP